jgi:ribonuclease HI
MTTPDGKPPPPAPPVAQWRRMRFKGHKVWQALGEEGSPLLRDGRVLIKYQPDQPYEYWVLPDKVRPLGEAAAPAAPQAPPPTRAPREKLVRPGDPCPPAEPVLIFTDGAALGNPGPAGIGVVLRFAGNVREISRYIGISTNNVAELEAIRWGLEALKRRDLPVRVYTDSGYAHGLLALGWKAHRNADLVANLRRLAGEFADLQFIKVRGHAGDALNERADELATRAAREGGG